MSNTERTPGEPSSTTAVPKAAAPSANAGESAATALAAIGAAISAAACPIRTKASTKPPTDQSSLRAMPIISPMATAGDSAIPASAPAMPASGSNRFGPSARGRRLAYISL